MLFTINDLGFSIAGLLLEGWLAFAARCVCALALLLIGWVVSRWMQKSLFPTAPCSPCWIKSTK